MLTLCGILFGIRHKRAGATWKGRAGLASQVQRAAEALALHWASPLTLSGLVARSVS